VVVKVISASTCAGIVVLDYSTYHARGPLTLPSRVFHIEQTLRAFHFPSAPEYAT